ncbi:hypothetical protein RR48_02297 [Papilio machaon]|uniref:Uncharacterized protein n=1 Tax=Papilio machaon TaxID=76193 RepID=A0A0N1IPA2_PAPMA|nr:hypothetical protein RR48_02297 [Papilio machaon]
MYYLGTFKEKGDEEQHDPGEGEGPARADLQTGEEKLAQVVPEPHPHVHHGAELSSDILHRIFRIQD